MTTKPRVASYCIYRYSIVIIFTGGLPEQPRGFEMFPYALVVHPCPLVVAVDVKDGNAVRRVNHSGKIRQVDRVR